jgi:hypothetical protein
MLSISLCRIKERRGVEMFEVFGNEIRNWSTHLQSNCSRIYRPIVRMNSQGFEILLFQKKILTRKNPAGQVSFIRARAKLCTFAQPLIER